MRQKLLLAVISSVLLISYTPTLDAGEWKEYKSDHFIIYYKEATNDFLKTVAKMAERYYEEISDNLGFMYHQSWRSDDRAKIYIYDDQGDYVANSNQVAWTHGTASPRNKSIKTFPSAHGFFDSTLPHELGHIIFREMIGMNAYVPTWFEEGIAMYQEQAKRFGAHDYVRQAIKEEKFISLGDLGAMHLNSNSDQDIIQLFYAESASIVLFMIDELGRERFLRLCREMKEKNSFQWALPAAYVRFKDVDELNKAWVKFLKNE